MVSKWDLLTKGTRNLAVYTTHVIIQESYINSSLRDLQMRRQFPVLREYTLSNGPFGMLSCHDIMQL